MGNTSIYIKDQALLERAKKLAGDEGFSAFIAKALADFVERKQDENRGLTDHSIYIPLVIPEFDPLIRFKGRLLTKSQSAGSKTKTIQRPRSSKPKPGT